MLKKIHFCAFFVSGLILSVISGKIFAADLPLETPEKYGVSSAILAEVTEKVLSDRAPVYSVLISRHGHLVYEMYTHKLTRDHSHYLMSVTKSFTATLVGIAIDKGLIKSTDASVADIFTPEWFDASGSARFTSVTVKNILSMSALDALVPPHSNTPDAVQRQTEYFNSSNRAKFALTQPLLPNMGTDFQYQDITPSVAIGMVVATSGKSSLEFAQENLFGPLQFKNVEWMHRDTDGLDMGGYGLRLRPVDMQTFGILYLSRGVFAGQRILSENWVETASHAVIKTDKKSAAANYGYYFWHPYFANDPTAIMASGWRGQFIATIPANGLVVTMTGCFLDGKEADYFINLVNKFVLRAVSDKADPKTGSQKLKTALNRAWKSTPINLQAVEPRMIPSVEMLEYPGP